MLCQANPNFVIILEHGLIYSLTINKHTVTAAKIGKNILLFLTADFDMLAGNGCIFLWDDKAVRLSPSDAKDIIDQGQFLFPAIRPGNDELGVL